MNDQEPMNPHPEQSDDDPTAAGRFCGALRRAAQRAMEGDDGHLYCRMPAGHRTDHLGVGRCRLHGGTSPNHRQAARLQLRELMGPALRTLALALTEADVPWSVKRQAASDLLDRGGFPRRLDVDVDGAKEALLEELLALHEGLDDDGPLADGSDGVAG